MASRRISRGGGEREGKYMDIVMCQILRVRCDHSTGGPPEAVHVDSTSSMRVKLIADGHGPRRWGSIVLGNVAMSVPLWPPGHLGE